MTFEQTQEYDDALVALLELVWGEGFMSPGGPDEIKMIVDEIGLAGKRVLDIGCGTGGIDQYLAEPEGFRPRPGRQTPVVERFQREFPTENFDGSGSGAKPQA